MTFEILNNQGVTYAKIGGRTYVNTTPHPITFGCDDGSTLELPKSSILIDAKPEEVLVKTTNGIEYVKTQFIKSDNGNALLEKIVSICGEESIIIGSIIAAQAYTGQVVALTPCKGYERVAPSEKRMNLSKFTIF